MNIQCYLKTIGYLLVSTALLLASCADDSLVDFSNNEEEGNMQAYTICDDASVFDADDQLVSAAFVGEYVKTRELVCGIVECNEAPFVTVQYGDVNPTLTLTHEGVFATTEGPFERYEAWSFLAAEEAGNPNRLALVDADTPGETFQVTILSAGRCRLRLENAQGWIEYSRLEQE